MNVKKLIGLRPKTDAAAPADPDEIARAAEAAQQEISAIEARLAELDRQRGATLLDGDADQVLAVEQEIQAGRVEGERLKVMVAELRKRETAARRQRAADEFRQVEADAEAKVAAYVAWHRANYERVAAELIQGLMLEAAALEALADQQRRPAPEGMTKARIDPPIERLYSGEGARSLRTSGSLGHLVRLPPASSEGNGFEMLWPPAPSKRLAGPTIAENSGEGLVERFLPKVQQFANGMRS